MGSLDDTVEFEYAPDSVILRRAPWQRAKLRLDAAGLSHQGHVRSNNEDHFAIASFGRSLELTQSNLPPDDTPTRHDLAGQALLVTDGLGGQAAGETASRAAINLLFQLVVETPDWIFRLDDPPLAAEIERRASQRMDQISQTMTQQADADPHLRGFGTTLTMAWGVGSQWIVAHVGDSRAYLCRQGELKQLTHDHTVAQALADAGMIKQTDVRFHRMRNRLTQLLGDDVRHVTPQIEHLVVQPGDSVLLCTDGLTDMLPDSLIAGLLAEATSAAECCLRLITAALDAGGKDNVTAIVGRFAADQSCKS